MKKKQDKYTEVMARRESLVVQEMPDETLVYDLNTHNAHCLNKTAAFVWSRCDGVTKPERIAAMMTKKWQKPVSEDLVWLAMKQLRRANLLEDPPRGHVEKMNASRRAAIRKLGVAAVLSPLVTSIVAPTAAAGASVPTVCLSCISRGEGQFFPEFCTTTCGEVDGTCYSNSGCGSGQKIGSCMSCKACAEMAIAQPELDIKSWESPGAFKCAP